MSWEKRNTRGIRTSVSEKKETPQGLWYKCPKCNTIFETLEFVKNLYVCKECNYHERINSPEYFSILFDDNKFKLLFEELKPIDFLDFTDKISYSKRLQDAKDKNPFSEAITSAVGQLNKIELIICCMNFKFIGGSMGSIVGERISKSINYCISHKLPLVIISKSGGARMMESIFSLMQMGKTAAKLTQLANHNLPFISVLTDPTTGGVTASFAMLGDVNIAEPKSLIGFAGPRVIKNTIKKELPENFQMSEKVLENGFLDIIVERKNLKETIYKLINILHKK